MYAGKPFNGEKRIFAHLMKHFLESALQGEMDFHLKEEKARGKKIDVMGVPYATKIA